MDTDTDGTIFLMIKNADDADRGLRMGSAMNTLRDVRTLVDS